MIFAAGKILQGSAETGLLNQSHVDLQPAAQDYTGPRGSFGQHLGNFIIFHEPIHQWTGFAGGNQDVQVTHGFPGAPIAAGSHHIVHSGHFLQIIDEAVDIMGGLGNHKTLFSLRPGLNCLKNRLFNLLAETFQGANASLPGSLRQLLEVFNF